MKRKSKVFTSSGCKGLLKSILVKIKFFPNFLFSYKGHLPNFFVKQLRNHDISIKGFI